MKNLKQKVAILLGIFFIFLMPQLAFAVIGDVPGTNWNVIRIVFGGEVPDSMLEPQNIFQQLFLPFLAVFFVMFGIMEEINFFRGHASIHAALALIIAFMASVTGILLTWVRWLYGGIGWVGVMGFGLLLGFGIIMWLWGRGRGIKRAYYDIYDLEKKITDVEKEQHDYELEAQQLQATLGFGGSKKDEIRKNINNALNNAKKKEQEKERLQNRLKNIPKT